MKKVISIAIGVIILMGGLVIIYQLQKKAEHATTIHYRGLRSPDTKTVYLADAHNVTIAKDGVLNLMVQLGNRFDAIIWITSTPDSFGVADAYDPTIIYLTADSATHAVALAAKIMRDSGWTNSAAQRNLFHSFALDDPTEELVRKYMKDVTFSAFTKVAYDYVPPRKR